MIAAAVLAAALAAVDPCAPVVPAAHPDPAAAVVYRAVGDEEASAGATDPAAVAYARAASLDPGDQRSRAGLRQLCERRRGDPASEAMARMDRGDLSGAAALLRAARARDDDPALALLEGICRYELGDGAAAAPLLRIAERSPDDADVARLYLGLLAWREGAPSRAATFFEAAAASDALSGTAGDLARAARQQDTWSVSLFAESGYDSNVSLAPPALVSSSDGDGLYGFGAAAALRPLGPNGPYLRAQGVLTRQVHLDAYDVSAAQGAAGWAFRSGSWSALGEYAYTYRTFGGAALLGAHQGLASASLALGRLSLGALYLARRERYADGFDPFSGTVQAAELSGALVLGDRVRLALAYGAALDAAEEAALSWREHGPRAEVAILATRTVRLVGVAAAAFRRYDAYDASLAARREDVYLDGEARLEWDVARRWSVRGGVRARRAWSNVATLEYAKVVPTAGLVYTLTP